MEDMVFFMYFLALEFFIQLWLLQDVLDDVTIDTIAGGYEVKKDFELLIGYQSYTLDKASDFFVFNLYRKPLPKVHLCWGLVPK
jgi:hypothetical protein